MYFNPFYSNYSAFVKAKDSSMVKDILTSEIADAVVNRKEEIIDRLNHSGLYVDSSVTTKQLSAIVSNNLSNPRFVQGLATVIGTKHPQDFEHFSNASGVDKKGVKKRVTQIDYFNDVFIAMSGNIAKGDAEIVGKVQKINTDDTEQRAATKKANLILLGIFGTSALAIWAIGIKKLI